MTTAVVVAPMSSFALLLTWLADKQSVSASTQNQALPAVLFLYRPVSRADPAS